VVRRNDLDLPALVGLFAFFGLICVALFGARLAPHEATYFVLEHGSDPRPYDPGLVFPFGSDILGRDILSLVLAGARATLTIVVLAGTARVIAGMLVAAIGSWWRPARLLTESVAELVSAVPATLVALVLVKVFLTAATSIPLVIGALVIAGWAGPYRVIRAEVDRLRPLAFTEGAIALGVGRWRIVWRHHLPHLIPVIAVNLSQQIIASLVLVAELGVLGIFVGATRLINVEESLTRVTTGTLTVTLLSDPPDWGGLLANARTVESLWTTRWLFLVPGVAFAITAIAVAAVGFALARRYARRDATEDMRGRGAAAIGLAVLALFAGSAIMPERYADAREWASAARSEVSPNTDVEVAFRDAGLRPVATTFAVTRATANILQTGPAAAKVGTASVNQQWPRRPGSFTNPIHVEPLITADTGGGIVEAPLVFVGRGIVPSEYPPTPACPTVLCGRPDIGNLIQDYANDYSGIDVHGKVVLLVRFLGVASHGFTSTLNGYSFGPDGATSIAGAIERGAAAVLFVDPALGFYTDRQENFTLGSGDVRGGVNPYLRLERELPPSSTAGVPVVVLDPVAAQTLLLPNGLDISAYFTFDEGRNDRYKRSPSRDLGISARVEVPLARQTASVTNYVGEVSRASPDAGHVLVWAVRTPGANHPSADVVAALARELERRGAPFVFVDFDPSIDPQANRQSIRDLLKDRRISLVVVLNQLDGTALRFTTPYGDLIPMFDLYADEAGVRHEVTRATATIAALSDIAPLVDVKTVVVSGNAGDGDLRPDAAALVGYLAGRLALGAEELPR
jgi:peptide/nickel transport system permease protein